MYGFIHVCDLFYVMQSEQPSNKIFIYLCSWKQIKAYHYRNVIVSWLDATIRKNQ